MSFKRTNGEAHDLIAFGGSPWNFKDMDKPSSEIPQLTPEGRVVVYVVSVGLLLIALIMLVMTCSVQGSSGR